MKSKYTCWMLGLSFLIAYSAFAEKKPDSTLEVVPLGKTMQISFDQKDWLYYQPKFIQKSGMYAFESHQFPNVHGILQTEAPTKEAPNLPDLCKQLADFPLDRSLPKNSKFELVTLGDQTVCRVTKHDKTQNAIQFIFVSKTKPKSGRLPSAEKPAKYYVHTLYFYVPKTDTAAEPLIAKLMQGLGSKK